MDYFLFPDPREWNRADVYSWLRYMKMVHNIPDIKYDRFLMNGKALCLMNLQMFCYRVPLGGKLLYKDFKMRLSKVLQAEDHRAPTKKPATATVTSAAAAEKATPAKKSPSPLAARASPKPASPKAKMDNNNTETKTAPTK